mgnify:FL=1
MLYSFYIVRNIIFMPSLQNKHVIIAGGGFAGIETARTLSKKVPKGTNIVLISNKSYFEYYPGLYRIVTGTSPIEVCIPLVDMVPENVEILVDTITDINIKEKKVTCKDSGEYTAEHLVIALGSETTYFNLPGIEELSFGFKSAKEATRLKNHIVSLFHMHEHPSPNDKITHFRIVVVGGGPSGVEVAGDLAVFLKKIAHLSHVDPSFITVDLIEAGPRLLAQLPLDVSKKVEMRLRMLGVNVFLNRRVEREEIQEIFLNDMSLKAKTVIWTAGTRLNSLFEKIEGLVFSERKRVIVDSFMQASAMENVYIVGDAAQTPFSGLAQTAMFDGNYVGRRIARLLGGKNDTREYKPKKNAFCIPVGNNWGVLVSGPVTLYGYGAYFMRHVIDFLYFMEILSPQKFFSVFIEGWKYRIRK